MDHLFTNVGLKDVVRAMHIVSLFSNMMINSFYILEKENDKASIVYGIYNSLSNK